MTPKAKEYIYRIRDRFLLGDDSGVYSVMEELNQGYLAGDDQTIFEVYSVFPASMRRMLKEIEGYYRDK